MILDHSGTIYDLQLDLAQRFLASASSQGSIRIYQYSVEHVKTLYTISAHKGPVYKVSWGHPKFKNLLASCSFDKKIKVWSEKSSEYKQIYCFQHQSPVLFVQWAPFQYGLLLAGCDQNGNISVHRYNQSSEWEKTVWRGHGKGSTCVTWQPSICLLSQESKKGKEKRLASAGCEGSLIIWKQVNNKFQKTTTLQLQSPLKLLKWAPCWDATADHLLGINLKNQLVQIIITDGKLTCKKVILESEQKLAGISFGFSDSQVRVYKEVGKGSFQSLTLQKQFDGSYAQVE